MKTLFLFILFLIGCSSIQKYEMVPFSGGQIDSDSIVFENKEIKVTVNNWENPYDLFSLEMQIENKSESLLKIDTQDFYLRNSEGQVFYPLKSETVLEVRKVNKEIEKPIEEFEMLREVRVKILKDGQIPPHSFIKGNLFFDMNSKELNECNLYLTGIDKLKDSMQLKNTIGFRDEDYHQDILKKEAKILKESQIKEANKNEEPKDDQRDLASESLEGEVNEKVK